MATFFLRAACMNRNIWVRRGGAINRVKEMTFQEIKTDLMSSQLTLASNGCNRETGGGQ